MAETHINIDMACIKCGYNLRTLAFNVTCPECGESVNESFKRSYLALDDRIWVRDVAIGAMLLAGVFVDQIVRTASWIFHWRHVRGGGPTRDLMLELIVVCTFVAGSFLITSMGRSKNWSRTQVAMRWLIRVCAVAAAITGATLTIHWQTYHFHFPDSFVVNYAWALGIVFWLAIIGWYGGMFWLHLGLTAHRETRCMRATSYLWVMFTFVVFCLMMPPPLILDYGLSLMPLIVWEVADWTYLPLQLITGMAFLIIASMYGYAWLRHGTPRVAS